MKTGSKYYPLYAYLSQSQPDELTLTLAEIERLLGLRCPRRASGAGLVGQPQRALQAAAWMSAGYHVEQVSLAHGAVTRKAAKRYIVQQAGGVVAWDGELVRACAPTWA
jgi:hypothetical protein